jgi:hypothetical protein
MINKDYINAELVIIEDVKKLPPFKDVMILIILSASIFSTFLYNI